MKLVLMLIIMSIVIAITCLWPVIFPKDEEVFHVSSRYGDGHSHSEHHSHHYRNA